MKAYMSDLDKRSRWLDYMETHYTATVEETGVSPEDWVLDTAWGEVRAILAETEPGILDLIGTPYEQSTPAWVRPLRNDPDCRIHKALAEALAEFIES